ncbi:MAG: hypothetical protein DCF20_01370 [Pseudanabaena sp.]|nr:MAG: hypothetical protein DCF20_01370 [Pseudanabaena sp.]
MRLHTQHTLRNAALGFVSLLSFSTFVNFSGSANAQSFPNDSVPPPASANNTQYVVYLPNVANLPQAKVLAPDAFVSRLYTGEQVVQLGRFNNLNLAQRRADQFSQAGLNPQIKSEPGKVPIFPSAPISSTPPIPNSAIPPNSVPPIPNNPPTSSAPVPVGAMPMPTSQTNEPLPNVPGSGFPNNNQIEIVRSPQPIPQQNQPFPPQNQPFPPQNIPQVAVQNVPTGPELRFLVIIPSNSLSELQRVQAVAPNAQLRNSGRGTFILVGAYPDRGSADLYNKVMRLQGFDSRVVFF